MEKIKVEEVIPKELEYVGCANDKCKKGKNKDGSAKCDCDKGFIKRRFTAYAVRADGRFFALKGSKARFVQAGDVLEGEIEERPYTNKDGEAKVAYDFILPKPVTPEMEALQKVIDDKDARLEELELKMAKMIEAGGNEDVVVKELADSEDLDSIPF